MEQILTGYRQRVCPRVWAKSTVWVWALFADICGRPLYFGAPRHLAPVRHCSRVLRERIAGGQPIIRDVAQRTKGRRLHDWMRAFTWPARGVPHTGNFLRRELCPIRGQQLALCAGLLMSVYCELVVCLSTMPSGTAGSVKSRGW